MFQEHLSKVSRVGQDPFNSYISLHKRERLDPYSSDLKSELSQKLHHSIMSGAFRYPDLSACYQALSNHFTVAQSQCLLTAGCDIALRTIYESLEVEYVYLPEICYAMNDVYINIYHPNATVVRIPYNPDGILDFDFLLQHLSTHNEHSLLVIENPSGSTAQICPYSQLSSIVELQLKNLVIVLDDTYHQCQDQPYMNVSLATSDNVLVVTSFSKSYGLAGLRIGAIISSEQNIKILKRVKPMHEISSTAALVLPIMLQDAAVLRDYRNAITSDLRSIKAILSNKNDLTYLPSNTNFCQISAKSAEHLEKLFLDAGVKIKTYAPFSRYKATSSFTVGNTSMSLTISRILASAS